MQQLRFATDGKLRPSTLARVLMELIPGCFVTVVLAVFPALADAQWRPEGVLRIPQNNYSFLAATPSGDLLACTFNTGGVNIGVRELPALLIRNPTSDAPQAVVVCRVGFDGQRGYSGVACDETGAFYVSGDTGQAATSFVRKFTADGMPDNAFGQGGGVNIGRRCLGVDVIGEYLLVVVDWGEIFVLNSATGRVLGQIPKGVGITPGPLYVRDIAIEPATLAVYGVAAGSVVMWWGGTPWEPQKYQFRVLTPAAGLVRSGEGISIDPLRKAALITPVNGNTLLEVQDTNNIVRTIVSSADPNTHLCDSVVSFDGQTLFISEITAGRIHVLTRDVEAALASRPTPHLPPAPAGFTPAPTPPPTVQPPQVTWYRSYTDIVEAARRNNRPMIVYFRRNGFAKCEQFESNVLLTNEFNARGQNYYCVFEDVDRNRLLAYRFGVIKIPCLIILGPQGQTLAEFAGNIDASALFSTLDRVAR
ncbi:MAG: hypothetical protein Kow0059_15100 [Candidatus Sumerlaeia bacterium]